MTDAEKNAKEEVVIAMSKWIIDEMKNASSMTSESIFPTVILAFAKLCDSGGQ